MDEAGPVLLFDGECGLCVRCVQVLLALDCRERLKFAPLQGETAQTFLRARGLRARDFESAIFVADWQCRQQQTPAYKTDALLASLRALGGIGRLALVARIVPRGWRDAVYDWIARRRKRLFAPVKWADLGTPEQKTRFLP